MLPVRGSVVAPLTVESEEAQKREEDRIRHEDKDDRGEKEDKEMGARTGMGPALF